MGSSSISPVLASFLAGKDSQVSLLKTAQDIMARKAADDNMVEERKQRQQTIDDTMKRFDVSSKMEQARIDLEHTAATDTHNLHLMSARQQFLQNLASGAEKPQSSPSGMMVPGMGIMPSVPQYQDNPVQTQQTPMGPISVNMPQTAIQSTLAQRAALDPLDIAKKKAEDEASANSKVPALQMRLDQNEKDAARKDSEFQQRMTQMMLMQQLGFGNQQAIAELKHQAELNKRFSGMSQEDYATQISTNAKALRNGTLEPNQIPNSQQRQDSINSVTSGGGSLPPKNVASETMQHAGALERYLNDTDTLKGLIGNNGRAGQAANYIRSLPGASIVSDNAASYNSISQGLKADLEKSQGLSLARAGSSPKMNELQGKLIPALTDMPTTVNLKVANGADLYMSKVAATLASLPPEARKSFYQRIVDEHPRILSSPVGPKLIQAAHSGLYETGINAK